LALTISPLYYTIGPSGYSIVGGNPAKQPQGSSCEDKAGTKKQHIEERKRKRKRKTLGL
jgi:hypothetical protein